MCVCLNGSTVFRTWDLMRPKCWSSSFCPRILLECSSNRCSPSTIVLIFFNCSVLPGPGHGPLLSLVLREVVPGKAVHLQPVGARVAPSVGLVTGNVEVARSLGVVTQGSILLESQQTFVPLQHTLDAWRHMFTEHIFLKEHLVYRADVHLYRGV